MRKILFFSIIVSLFAIFSCSKVIVVKPDPEDLAGKAAKQYYEYLKNGDCEAFVDGTYRENTLRENFREELVESAKMYKGRFDGKYGGITGIAVKSSAVDTTQHVASVYLNLKYGNGSKETILVPMVEKNGIWYLR